MHQTYQLYFFDDSHKLYELEIKYNPSVYTFIDLDCSCLVNEV
jgi:hypothetical protein